MISYYNQKQEKFKNISFLEHSRFMQIYLLSLKLPSWEVIGLNLLGSPITEEEYSFVITKTRRLNRDL
jgi:hypothetical protein